MARVQLIDVEKRFGDKVVVQKTNLDIEDGDFVVLVGPSGCGKSTTLRMIAGLEKVSGGAIQIADRDVSRLTPRDRDVAMVFQSYALYPHMSVSENMGFGLKLRRMDKAEIEKRVRAAADILGIQELLGRKPKELSGGQRQRVAMGRAIVRQPAVFLFDEPLSNLDAKLRVQMRAEIARLHQRLGTTTIYVTHDQIEAMTLAKHIVVMSNGVVQQVGPPLEVYKRPENTFVAGFIGSPAMNFLQCEYDGSAGIVRGKTFSISLPDAIKLRLDRAPSKELVLGVRPEHVFEAKPSESVLPCKVDVLEPLGAEVHALATIEGNAFTARLDPETQAKVGVEIGLGMTLDHVHFFDRKSGAVVR
ncbi:MAG: sn-glycerol-3-phosphate ABC transporter ATP-binding protein UgpC [Deltaproteobacteria bacterium]|nr:sn-glycerol-3-phosphate ABC transporter ATP-binding protein UgpC [Deltaproteobacteria bacterium]